VQNAVAGGCWVVALDSSEGVVHLDTAAKAAVVVHDKSTKIQNTILVKGKK